MKKVVITYSMVISQSTGYLLMRLASFSRILFAISWRFLLTCDCFGSGCEGWQIRSFDLPAIKTSFAILSMGAAELYYKI